MRSVFLYTIFFVLLFVSCKGHSHGGAVTEEADSLASCISDMRYRNAALLDSLAVDLIAVSGGNNELEMVARNAMGYSALMKMDYGYAEELYNSVVESSSCEIERLVADVGLMTISYRTSANREFFDYRARALRRIARINEDVEFLSSDDHERFYRAKIEFGIVSICYYSNLAMFEERASALEFLKSNFEKTDNFHHKIYADMKDYISRRRQKQPLEFPSAGSTFKRCEGYYTSQLIDEAGLKGLSVGGAQVSEKHAGFVINRGGATASDVLSLIDKVKEEIKKKYGVCIECEVEYFE